MNLDYWEEQIKATVAIAAHWAVPVFTPTLTVTKRASADVVRPGERLTYTIRVTNTSDVDLHVTVTDTLPISITQGETSDGTLIAPGGVVTWTPTITANGGIWTETVVVTAEVGYVGPLTNVVYVTSEEGATATCTETVEAQATPALEVTKRASADVVRPGERLTYTIRVTNTGNVHLHVTVTDVLPSHVSPGGVLTWTATIPAPTGVWEQATVVTVEMGYSGVFTNMVQITSEEGATGAYAETCAAVGNHVYLPVVFRDY